MKRLPLALAVVALLALVPGLAEAQPSQLEVNVDGVGQVSAPLQVVLVITLLTFIPAMLVTMTSFTRIVIVFHFLRQAIGSQETPPNQVLIGLALFLTMFIMAPVGERIHADAVQPVVDGQMSVTDALARATPPLREFMLRQTREKDLALFVELGRVPTPESADQLPMRVVI
nr:flagellar biosynthetic protein FliP [Vicinamibacterales bacterium]